MINESSILARTLYGVEIYSHAIRERWPDEIAMTVRGDYCGLCRNPLSEDGARTLRIWTEKLNPEQRLSDKIARHHDESGLLDDGTCFDFAERLYGLSGQELLDHINRELHLHLEPEWAPYGSKFRGTFEKLRTEGPRMSFFRCPITRVTPEKDVTLHEVYDYIVGDEARERTAQLRSFTDPKEAKRFKAARFDFITPSGQFTTRKADGLVQHTGLLTIDFDHLVDVEDLFYRLLTDEYLDTALAFRSPSGDGIKWIIHIDLNGFTHAEYFRGVSGYIRQTYGILIDQSGSDVARSCFLAHDPRAYINPLYL